MLNTKEPTDERERISIETLMVKEYDADEINDIGDDAIYSLDNNKLEYNKNGDITGKIRVTVEYIPVNACDCEGFTHKQSCKHWVIGF